MKRKPKRLRVAAETVRTLGDVELKHVAGGDSEAAVCTTTITTHLQAQPKD